MATKAQIADLLEGILGTLSSNPQMMTSEVTSMLSTVMSEISSWVERKNQEEAVDSESQETLLMLWHVAGGNPEAFARYLQTFPDPAIQQISADPRRVQEIIQRLSQEQPSAPTEMARDDGIPESDIPSSNVFGFRYDKRNQKLLVKFNGKDVKTGGPVYAYDGVPSQIFDLLSVGAIPAKTAGKNKWGRWWRNKVPSVGASVFQLLKMGGYPYKKVRG